MLKRAMALLAAAPAVAALLMYAPTAQADDSWQDHRHCVTQDEFWDVRPGMTRAEAQVVLDGPGSVFAEGTDDKFITRRYPVCELPFHRSRVIVVYFRGSDTVQSAFKVRYTY